MVGGGLQDFSVSVPLVLLGFLNWVGVGPRCFGDKVLGTGLDNKKNLLFEM